MPSPCRRLLLFALLLAVACGARAQVMATPPALPGSHYDPALFENPVAADQLEFLRGYIGRPAKELMHNRQFWKLAQAGFLPRCTFHYGRDRPLAEAFDWVVSDSKQPVAILQGRYLVLASDRPQQLDGEAMLWIDLEAGIGVGAFYFHPVNGEPTPTVNVFARQVVPGRANLLEMSQLPPAFRVALMQWTDSFRLPPLTPRYFLTGNNRKILLEHDEDYCRLLENTPPSADPACEQRNAEAAKVDVVAASYLREAGFATNATAFFMPAFRVAWMAGSADKSGCAHGPDLYPCQVAWSRARVRTILDGR